MLSTKCYQFSKQRYLYQHLITPNRKQKNKKIEKKLFRRFDIIMCINYDDLVLLTKQVLMVYLLLLKMIYDNLNESFFQDINKNEKTFFWCSFICNQQQFF